MGVPHIALLSTDVETTFATDQVETWRDQRVVEGSIALDLKEAHIPNLAQVQQLHAHNPMVMGSQFGSTFPMDLYMEGLPTALDTAAAYSAPQNHMLEVLAAAFGGVRGGAGSTVLGAGATTTSIPVQVGHGARYAKGGAAIIGGECAPIEDISGDTLTLKRALSAAPAAATPVYNTVTLYFDASTFGTSGYSLVCRLLGELAGDQWIARGCVPKFTVGGSWDELLVAKVAMTATTWEKTSGHSLATASHSGAGGLPIGAGYIYYGDLGVATRNAPDFDGWTIDPGINFAPLRSLDGIETVSRYRQLRQTANATLRVPAYVEQDEYYEDDASRQLKYMMIQFGTGPRVGSAGTGVVAFEFPTCEITATPKRDASGEFLHTEVNLRALLDQDVATPTTALHYSPVKVHVG